MLISKSISEKVQIARFKYVEYENASHKVREIYDDTKKHYNYPLCLTGLNVRETMPHFWQATGLS
jgi:hypothetical protein